MMATLMIGTILMALTSLFLLALDPHEGDTYKGGQMTVKASHDGSNVFFLLEVDGDYVYSKGNSKNYPSVTLIFQVRENASYHNMGGSKEEPDSYSTRHAKAMKWTLCTSQLELQLLDDCMVGHQ